MVQDLASTRLDNALRLFEEFVQATVKHPDAATLRGLEGRFAERLGIQPSYWSQIKSRSPICRGTTTSASSSGWSSPTTGAIRNAPAPVCSTCSAKC